MTERTDGQRGKVGGGGRIAVYVEGGDPVTRAGVQSQLRLHPELLVVDRAEEASVAIVALEQVDAEGGAAIRSLARREELRVLVLAGTFDDAGLLMACEAGAVGVLRRHEATPERLADQVHAAAAGGGAMPSDLLARLLGQIGRLQRNELAPRGVGPHGLTEREVAVLRLLADGHDTNEIAGALAFSERTVKSVLHEITTRFNLRNRCHAVAYALREGVI